MGLRGISAIPYAVLAKYPLSGDLDGSLSVAYIIFCAAFYAEIAFIIAAALELLSPSTSVTSPLPIFINFIGGLLGREEFPAFYYIFIPCALEVSWGGDCLF